MTPDRLGVYIEAVARSHLPGTRAELRALIHQWADVGGVADAQHQELLEAADGLAPALIGENVQWFCRRLEDYAGSQVLPATDEALVRCGDCRHFLCDIVNPPQGLGRCTVREALGHQEPPLYPAAWRRCRHFSPKERPIR